MIDTLTNHIEHPELIAQRIGRYADLVGRERVIAATDCGFGTFVGVGVVHPSIAWAKLRALAEGADLATKIDLVEVTASEPMDGPLTLL